MLTYTHCAYSVCAVVALKFWGMVLTVIAYRLVNPAPFFASVVCHYPINSFSSFLGNQFKIRNYHYVCSICNQDIIPFIEVASPIIIFPLFLVYSIPHAIAYSLFFSALIITIYTDYTRMLISRFVTLFAIPFAYLACMFNLLPISLSESIIGSISGFVILFSIAKTFSLLRGKEGLGQGDIDLITFIGSCTGIVGVWLTLLIGSIIGSCWGIAQIIRNRSNNQTSINEIVLPFGPFLAFGAICAVYLLPHISRYIVL